MPVVFISGYGDIPSSVRAMKRGAVTFLSKPLDKRALIEAIQEALAEDAARKQDSAERRLIHDRLGLLTEREQEIFTYVITGLLNKQIAAALNISEKTVKTHRGRVMQKMKARSLAELVRMAHKAGITPAVLQ
jgi:RNA polymerase sigma factor (sigma-70 family)